MSVPLGNEVSDLLQMIAKEGTDIVEKLKIRAICSLIQLLKKQ